MPAAETPIKMAKRGSSVLLVVHVIKLDMLEMDGEGTWRSDNYSGERTRPWGRRFAGWVPQRLTESPNKMASVGMLYKERVL